MFFSWIWESPETLLGILTADGLTVETEEGAYTASLVSIGFLLCRIDIIFNKEKNDD